MKRKGSDDPQPAALPERNLSSALADAMDALVRGYSEEIELYSTVRALTRRQSEMLRGGWSLDLFADLLDEKEDLLRMIGQIESLMKKAKSLVLAKKPPEGPNRWKLEKLLDRLTAIIEEIRLLEGDNASILEDAFSQAGAPIDSLAGKGYTPAEQFDIGA